MNDQTDGGDAASAGITASVIGEVLSAPSKTAWACNDGITYWR